MITAQKARESLVSNISVEQEERKQKEKAHLEKLLNQAIQEEINKNSSKVSRILNRGTSLQAEIIREILWEKWFENISVQYQSEDHDRYVDYWVSINFSF